MICAKSQPIPMTTNTNRANSSHSSRFGSQALHGMIRILHSGGAPAPARSMPTRQCGAPALVPPRPGWVAVCRGDRDSAGPAIAPTRSEVAYIPCCARGRTVILRPCDARSIGGVSVMEQYIIGDIFLYPSIEEAWRPPALLTTKSRTQCSRESDTPLCV